MSDNISRQAALAYPLSWDHYDKEHGNRHFISGVESYREYIESLPSTDRKGHWVGVCEYCHHLTEVTGELYLPSGFRNHDICDQCWQSALEKSDYCPNCGADMRGAQGGGNG